MVFDFRRFVTATGIILFGSLCFVGVLSTTGCERTIDADPASYVGVGVELTMVAAGARVVRTLPGSAAVRGGLEPDDVILSIDKTSARGLGLAEVVDLLRGGAGTPVKVRISTKHGDRDQALVRSALQNRH